MKAVIALYLALVAAVSASPLEARGSGAVKFALSNDQTGAYATAQIATDGLPHAIGVLWAGTSLVSNGKVYATSAQLATLPAGINCAVTNNGATIATLTERVTFADLDGNPNEATPVNLNGGKITCHV